MSMFKSIRAPKLRVLAIALAAAITDLSGNHVWAQTGQSGPGSQSGGQGNDPSNFGDPATLPGVTVRGQRSMDDRFNAPGSRVIVSKEDIEAMGADSISDVLRQLPGVLATQGADGRTEIRMRGMDKNATQILVDGERQGGSRRGGQLPIDQIPADLIERVEVIRSPMAEFSGASGGTINIVLKQAVIQRETNMRFSVQHSFGKDSPQLFISRTGPFFEPPTSNKDLPLNERIVPPSYFFGMSVYERTGGNDRTAQVLNPQLDSNGIAFENKEARIETSRSRTRELVMFPRTTIKLGATDTLAINPFLVVGSTRTNVNSQATGTRFGNDFQSESLENGKSDRYQGRMSTTWTHRFNGSKLETRGFFEKGGEQSDRQSFGNTTIVTPLNANVTTSLDKRAERVWNLSTKLTGTEEAHVWTFGGEIEDRYFTANTNTLTTAPARSDDQAYISNQKRLSAFAQDEWTLLKDGTLTAGLRVENLSRDTNSAGIRYEDQSTRFQPSLNWRQPINKEWQYRAGLASNSRIPALLDVVDRTVTSSGANTSTRPDTVGNPLLKAERTLSLDTGFEYRTQALQGGSNLFIRNLKDPIIRPTFFSNGRWVQRPDNGLAGHAWGIESDLRAPLAPLGLVGWNAIINLSWLASKIDLANNGAMGAATTTRGRIPGQPHYIANLNINKPANQRAGGWFGGAIINLTGASDLADSATGSGRAKSVARLDLNIGYVIQPFGMLRLGINNVTNVSRDRVRYDLDPVTGSQRVESISDSGGRSFFFSFGTRF